MKIGSKIFLSYLIIIGVGFFYLTNIVIKNIATRYLEGVEESLVDEARILASFASFEFEKKRFTIDNFHKVFDNVYKQNFSARIYKLSKKDVDVRVYITDKNGILLFDSKRLSKPGANYSQWLDVHKTLLGNYGARSTASIPGNSESRVLYVASPIIVKSEVIGVLTVAKPSTNINIFIHDTAAKVLRFSYLAAFAFVVLSFVIVFLITKPIKKLTDFANDIREGKRVNLPKLGNDEIGQMGKAFEGMLEEIEGKKYVEKYVHTLTHEIKSPVSAIKGAAELLNDEMPKKQMMKFLNNINTESQRIQDIVDRMLELSSLENRKELSVIEEVNLTELLKDVIESFEPLFKMKAIDLKLFLDDELKKQGDQFVLRQVFANLIKNAIEFSSFNDTLIISLKKEKNNEIVFEVIDSGPGIPEYAIEKLFDKFYSLPRPETGKKSTGLGLSFVKEAVSLHGGVVTVKNRSKGGVVSAIHF
ncbi:MAG: two-component system sensor histidine kinase CreC [Deltaproteobacteria bacterium]|nr:two-component system sensor histidine kinase CreC [Deltaproteobacteria bacterium]